MRYVYDIETLPNCLIVCAVSTEEDRWRIFECSTRRNDLADLIKFLEHPGLELVGYNNIGFDSQICESLIRGQDSYLTLPGEIVAEEMYRVAQEVLARRNANIPPLYYENDLTTPQIDLYKIHHFDNKARATSLKTLQVNMRWGNVQDMPFAHDTILEEDQIDEVIHYCRNDVLSTREFYKHSKSEIELRENLGAKYKLNLINKSNSSIGEQMMLHMLAKATKTAPNKLKSGKTYRDSIRVADILLPIVKFNTVSCQRMLERYKEEIIYETKNSLKLKATIGNIDVEYGTGGAHGCIENGVYESNETVVIRDIDVTSFYPNLAIVNGFRPEHLGQAFNDIYADIFQQRTRIPKKDPRNQAFKLMLNSVFGKSNNKYSFLYDPQFTLQITINGQLLISMLAEELAPYVTILQVNTDGLTVMYDKANTMEVEMVIEWWEKLTKLNLEHAFYDKMIIRDVNSYISVKPDGDIKTKGVFVDTPEWHQDCSFLIIPKALQAFFVHDIDPEEFVNSHQDVWDFLGRERFNSKMTGYVFHINEHGEKVEVDVGRTVRYYLAKRGSALVKKGEVEGNPNYESILYNGHPVKVVNKFDIEDGLPDLERSWYVQEIYKIINAVLPDRSRSGEQLGLF